MVRCSDNSLYTGVATDTVRRAQEHNNDDLRGAKYTRVRRPVTLVYQESFGSRSMACKREAQLKRLSKKQKEALIASRV